MDVTGVWTSGPRSFTLLAHPERSESKGQPVQASDKHAFVLRKKQPVEHKSGPTLQSIRAHVHYVYHSQSGKYYIQMINDKTSEVIREIPPKRVLDRYAALVKKFGLLVDQRA